MIKAKISDIIPVEEFKKANDALINKDNINVAELLDLDVTPLEILRKIDNSSCVKNNYYDSEEYYRVLTTILYLLDTQDDGTRLVDSLNTDRFASYIYKYYYPGILGTIDTFTVKNRGIKLNSQNFPKLQELTIDISEYYAFNSDKRNDTIDSYILPELRKLDLSKFKAGDNNSYNWSNIFDKILMPKLEEVILPKDVEEIPEYCFHRCLTLKKITLPKSVKKIGYKAFNNCPDVKIKISSNANFVCAEDDLEFLQQHIQ